MGSGWVDGNILLGYPHREVFSKPIQVLLPDHKRIFSLSSVTSRPSMIPDPAPTANLDIEDKPRFDRR